MARITVEDCIEKVPNRFHLVQMASIRTKQLKKGARPLVESEENPPSADAAYRQARIRLALEEERRRHASVLLPLRTLHLVLGFGALATAGLLVPFSPALGVLAAPMVISAVAIGAQLLSEATPGGLH